MLGGGLEDLVLCGLVWNENLAPQIALQVRKEDFSTATYRRIAEVALDFLERHHRAARIHIADILEHDIKRGRDGRFMQEVLVEMERMAPELNEAYVLSELSRFLAIQRLTSAVNTASDFLRNGSLEEAEEILRQPNLLPNDSPGVWLRDTESWLSFLHAEEDSNILLSGIDALDERGVRPAPGELFVLLAASGMGKSWFLINAGRSNVLDARKNVLHITLENSLDITLQRYTQCFLGLSRDEGKSSLHVRVFNRRAGDPNSAILHPHSDDPDIQSLTAVGKEELATRLSPFQSRGQLLVKHFPTGTLTIGMLSAYLDALERVQHFKPDVILLDYLTLMDLNTRDLRVSIGQLTRNLRGLASQRQFALLTVTQANREARHARYVTSRHVAEDWSIVATSDVFVTYSQTTFERKMRVARLFVEKARNSTDKWNALVTQAYEIGQFHLDSEFLTAALEDQIREPEEENSEERPSRQRRGEE